MPDPDYEKILKNLVDQLERLYFEYDALRAFLRSAESQPELLQYWKAFLEVQKVDPIMRAASHALFDRLRSQLRECADAEAVVQVLTNLGHLLAEKEWI